MTLKPSEEEHVEGAKDAVADAIIFLLDYCNHRGWDAETLLRETWERVRQRDFRARPHDPDPPGRKA